MKTLFIFIAATTLATASFSQSDSLMLKKIVDETMTNATAYSNLRRICKEIGPRLSGSANYIRAVGMTEQMLKVIGADTIYRQSCMVPHWVRGVKEKGFISLAGGKKFRLHLTALGNSVATPKKGVRGDVIEVRSMEEMDQLGEKFIKGNIVFFNFKMNPAYIWTFRAYGESGISRKDGPARAAKYGAVGAIVRSLSVTLNDYPHTGATQYEDGIQKIPAIAISTNDAEYLSTQLRKKTVNNIWFKTSCKMLPDSEGYNVVGEMKGSEHPDEIITVGGHLDSWDLAEGANDDGSGCVQSIEVMRTFKALGIHPKRTIRIVLFANEENGVRGGEAYFKNAKAKNEKHVFALESDAGGFTPRGFSFKGSQEHWQKIKTWQPLLYPYGVYFFIPGGGGADIEKLGEIGCALSELYPDSQRYFFIHHAVTDTFEEVDERELNLGAANMAALVWLVSERGL